MNDEMEMIEEFQSDSIDDLVHERKKRQRSSTLFSTHILTNQILSHSKLCKWRYIKKRDTARTS